MSAKADDGYKPKVRRAQDLLWSLRKDVSVTDCSGQLILPGFMRGFGGPE
ncbi:MAG TPA: hypothetical protein VLD59_18840 [Steroidobacteraceae bacterium]|nr:hypothetical protein [Steroidobacteraceae bacterium]